MADIYHQVGIQGTPQDIYAALTLKDKLTQWWTSDIHGADESMLGETLQFRFGGFGPDMKVTRLEPGKVVQWQCVAGHGDWVNTHVLFELKKTFEQTFVNFRHEGFRDMNEMYSHCSTKWAIYLLSLKRLVEKGQGRPYPKDIPINHTTKV